MNDDNTPFQKWDADGNSNILLICDHSTNFVPASVNGGTLGLAEKDMSRHIAFDIGAAGVTRSLAHHLNAPYVMSGFSRLVIDPNRGVDDPTLIMQLYDGSVVPGNRDVNPAETTRRTNKFYTPYQNAIADMTARYPKAALVSIHSFSPRLNGGQDRPWHLGILYAEDRRLADPILAILANDPDICVGNNQPYSGHLSGDTMDRHGVKPGRPHVLIEIRNDLISSAETQEIWGARLAILLQQAMVTLDIS